MKYIAILVLTGLWLSVPGSAIGADGATPSTQTSTGKVVRVVDGDTLWIITGQAYEPLKVRLLGIDAPEICQQGGKEARDALKAQVMYREVVLAWQRHDGYGRVLGKVSLDGADIARAMVSQGHAWSDGYRWHAGLYADEQAQAQRSRVGLFAEPAPETPRNFRKRNGACHF